MYNIYNNCVYINVVSIHCGSLDVLLSIFLLSSLEYTGWYERGLVVDFYLLNSEVEDITEECIILSGCRIFLC